MGSRPRRERCNLGHMAIQPTLSPQAPLVASHGRPRGPHVPPWTPLRWAGRRCQLVARPWTPIHRRHRAPEGYASQDSVAFWSHGAARSLVPVHARPGGRLRCPHGGLAGGQGRGAVVREGLGAPSLGEAPLPGATNEAPLLGIPSRQGTIGIPIPSRREPEARQVTYVTETVTTPHRRLGRRISSRLPATFRSETGPKGWEMPEIRAQAARSAGASPQPT